MPNERPVEQPQLGLAQERDEQASMLIFAEAQIGSDIEVSASEVGTWYSPAYVRELLGAQREQIAAQVEARAGLRGTGAWVALTAAADAIREA